MSYDLYFIEKNNESKLTKAEFVKYFQNRPLYNVEESQAWYSNEDSGVYFCFEYQDNQTSSTEEFISVALFNINFNRPHVFGLEAEPEVKSFVDKFQLNIFDPQVNGMGEGSYSSEGFIQGWNEGNIFGITAMMGQSEKGEISISNDNLLALPYKEIERYWKWNYNRDNIQDKMIEDIYVPRIMFMIEQNQAKSFVVWTDAIPMVLPKVDKVVLFKNKLAPRHLFSKNPITSLVDYEAVISFFPLQELYTEQGLGYKKLYYNRPPQKILEFFAKQKPITIQGVTSDKILDTEMIEKAKESAGSLKTLENESEK